LKNGKYLEIKLNKCQHRTISILAKAVKLKNMNRKTIKKMENIIQTYRQFFQDNFAGLKLRKPLFYSWDCSLRFDLQDEYKSADNEKYFVEVIRRATTIFETTFEPSDKLFFVFKDYRNRREKIRPANYAFRQIDKLEKSEIFYTREKVVYYPDDEYNVALVCLTANRINYKNILTAIANTDFPSQQPRLDNRGVFTSKEIYFVNIGKRLIFHIYDDRGLDIIAADKEILRPILEKHNDWILDYDREQIDKQFE